MPQKVSVADIDTNITIFMRVNNVYKDKIIKIMAGEKEIAVFKKKHLAPSEMERIVLKKSVLEGLEEDLSISLE